jgi:hypothetical protein
MTKELFGITALVLICLSVYLFVHAPPLISDDSAAGSQIPVQKMFDILNAENAAVRALWTKAAVEQGKASGLKFDEHWKETNVEAGPLPALFLRETAKSLVKSPTLMRLFLGSDYPIASSNKFIGVQLRNIQNIRKTMQPQYFYDPNTKMYMAMYPDVAVTKGCVDCHNNHPDSPKKDWRLNDIMGATTWSYPKALVSSEEIVKNISYLRHGFKEAYMSYLDKVQTFVIKPEIGERWPRDGYFLPKIEIFVQTIEHQNSAPSLSELTKVIVQKPIKKKKTKKAKNK